MPRSFTWMRTSFARLLHLHVDELAGVAVLVRVLQQVHQHLLQPVPVALHPDALARHVHHEGPVEGLAELIHHLRHQLPHLQRRAVHLQLAQLQPRRVQQVIHQPHQPVHLPLGLEDAGELHRLPRGEPALHREEAQLERRERRLQLVRRDGHELLAHPQRRLRLPQQPRVLHRHRELPRRRRPQIQLPRGERGALLLVEQQQPHRALGRAQRHGGEDGAHRVAIAALNPDLRPARCPAPGRRDPPTDQTRPPESPCPPGPTPRRGAASPGPRPRRGTPPRAAPGHNAPGPSPPRSTRCPPPASRPPRAPHPAPPARRRPRRPAPRARRASTRRAARRPEAAAPARAPAASCW